VEGVRKRPAFAKGAEMARQGKQGPAPQSKRRGPLKKVSGYNFPSEVSQIWGGF